MKNGVQETNTNTHENCNTKKLPDVVVVGCGGGAICEMKKIFRLQSIRKQYRNI